MGIVPDLEEVCSAFRSNPDCLAIDRTLDRQASRVDQSARVDSRG